MKKVIVSSFLLITASGIIAQTKQESPSGKKVQPGGEIKIASKAPIPISTPIKKSYPVKKRKSLIRKDENVKIN